MASVGLVGQDNNAQRPDRRLVGPVSVQSASSASRPSRPPSRFMVEPRVSNLVSQLVPVNDSSHHVKATFAFLSRPRLAQTLGAPASGLLRAHQRMFPSSARTGARLASLFILHTPALYRTHACAARAVAAEHPRAAPVVFFAMFGAS